jgi:hypothetical protein
MSQSDDYQRGYFDGYLAAKNAPLQPYAPTPSGQAKVTCPKCNMVWEGVMGYVCPSFDCPIQPKVR